MRTLLIFFCLISILGCKDSKEHQSETATAATTTYYLIRHAEKDRSDPENKDPQLTEQGNLRAAHWAEYFKDIPLDVVYSSDYHRTRQTAQPTADSKELALKIYQAGNLYNRDFVKETQGKQLLIVGHSNTIPTLVNQLVQKHTYQEMNDKDNASLFVVIMNDKGTNVKRKAIRLP